MKKLLVACLSMLCLAIAFHLGASNAQSQTAHPKIVSIAVAIGTGYRNMYAVDELGNIYSGDAGTYWRLVGSVWHQMPRQK